MRIKRYVQGPLETNCYVVVDEDTGRAGIVDPVTAEAAEFIAEKGLRAEWILLTHGHFDHIAGVPVVKSLFPDIPVAINGADAAYLTEPGLNLSYFAGPGQTVPPADRSISDGDTIELGCTILRAIATPGHTPGSTCFAVSGRDGKVASLIAGDTLFCLGVGRTDLPGGDEAQLGSSLRRLFGELADDVRVDPGHGQRTTIGVERVKNPFVM